LAWSLGRWARRSQRPVARRADQ